MSDGQTLEQLHLRVHEIYLSLQGESTFAGLPCVFVRTTGCPLRCVWCDTEHAFYGGEDHSVAAVLARALDFGVQLVEVTGGEPLAQRNVLPLMSALADAGRTVLLETSGAFDITPVDDRVHVIMDIKCPDSGEHDKNLWSNLDALRAKDELKLVLASRRDYEFARDLIRERGLAERCSVLLSTVWGGPARADVAAWILADKLPVRFQLQMHKLIWDPEARGV
ncbi:MAG: radical SAM protein [Myxococcales bacterium]|nr:radical SAM protein [Myxococcales bacterium]